MTLSYNGLWKILIDKELKKVDLIEQLGLSSSTVAKLSKNKPVSLAVLEKICNLLECNIGDVLTFIKEEK